MKQIVKISATIFAAAAFFAVVFFVLSYSNSFSIIQNEIAKIQKSGEDKIDGNLELENENKITLVAVGDIMLSRDVERKMVGKNDWKYPFERTADITSGADIAFGNLETPILQGDPVPTDSLIFRADPKSVEGLKFAGFDVLSLANNHMMNFGHGGLQSTLNNLDSAGISHVGAGLNESGIYKPVIKTVKGIKFGFLAYSYSNEQSVDKDKNIYGVAKMNVDLMKSQVAELRKSVDVVVVSMHAGTEYSTVANGAQINFAHSAIDAGADLVIGHHPHVVENFEKYNNGYIIYSLGNFVFDQMWSDETKLGVIAKITFNKNKIYKIDFIPIKIFDFAQPRLAEGSDKDKILQRLEVKEN